MKFKIVKKCKEDLSSMHGLLKSFLPFARKRMGFNKPPKIYFQSDDANAKKLLGKTAHYDPTSMSITVYVTGRHPKDVLRSLSHELVHHAQNCRGEFAKLPQTSVGYAQNDSHLRAMEEEAYKEGNLCMRDWEDGVKGGSIRVDLKLNESKNNIVSMLEAVSISRGMGSYSTRNRDVAIVQSLLVQSDSSALPRFGIDGIFRGETQAAVKKFQKKNQLDATGTVDQQTYDLLVQKGDLKKAEEEAESLFGGSASPGMGYTGDVVERKERVDPKTLFNNLVSSFQAKGLSPKTSQEVSKALVANAKGESNFVIGIAGDHGDYASVKHADKSIPIAGDGPACSLGLWQFNVCGGLGLDFMRAKGLSHANSTDQQIYDTITDYDNQIDYMTNYLASRGLPKDKNVYFYISWLVKNVIRPAEQARAIKLRKGHYESLRASGAFGLDPTLKRVRVKPSRKMSKGGILYLGDSQMQGNFGKALVARHGSGALIAKQGTTASNWVRSRRLLDALKLKPSRIIISLGGNGVGDAEGLLRMIKDQAPNASVIWSGAPPPVKDRFYTKGDRYESLFRSRKANNSRIKQIVEDAGFKFIDPYDYFTSYTSKGDGIHLPRDVAYAYVDKTFNEMSSPLNEWKNKELNRLLLEKFNLGVTK